MCSPQSHSKSSCFVASQMHSSRWERSNRESSMRGRRLVKPHPHKQACSYPRSRYRDQSPSHVQTFSLDLPIVNNCAYESLTTGLGLVGMDQTPLTATFRLIPQVA